MKWVALFVALGAQAEITKTEWSLVRGKLTYHVSFPLKSVEGTSENVKGKGQCAGETCEFLIATPVKSFESGDGNRDAHMIEVTRGAAYPMVTARVKVPKSASTTSMDGSAEVSFGGQTHTYPVHIIGRTEGPATFVSGTIPLRLSDFKMERPSLLGVKIKDEAPVSFELRWE